MYGYAHLQSILLSFLYSFCLTLRLPNHFCILIVIKKMNQKIEQKYLYTYVCMNLDSTHMWTYSYSCWPIECNFPLLIGDRHLPCCSTFDIDQSNFKLHPIFFDIHNKTQLHLQQYNTRQYKFLGEFYSKHAFSNFMYRSNGHIHLKCNGPQSHISLTKWTVK